MIKIFEKFTQFSEVETYINICKEILVDFDLNRPGKSRTWVDTYGNFKVLFDKYYEIKEVLLEKFPDFKIKNNVSYGGKYPVNHLNWAESLKLKNNNFEILLEINHSTLDNPDYGGRLRFWAGIEDTEITCYRRKPKINISEFDPWGEEDWGDE